MFTQQYDIQRYRNKINTEKIITKSFEVYYNDNCQFKEKIGKQ